MKRTASFAALALISSTFGWVCLGTGLAGFQVERGDAQVAAGALMILGSGFSLLALALAGNAFNVGRTLQDRTLTGMLSIAGLLSTVPISIILGNGGDPVAVAFTGIVLGGLPAVVFASRAPRRRDGHDQADPLPE